MDAAQIKIVRDVISPLINQGQASLFLGAGFSRENTRQDESKIPDGNGLRDLILTGCGKAPSKTTSLKDAYSLGRRVMDDFDSFLIDCFTVNEAFVWQRKIFEYNWDRIYTTNIDNVLSVAHKETSSRNSLSGEFTFYNYKDPSLNNERTGGVPVVSIHGSCSKLSDGFVFSSIEYARASNKIYDWHRDIAARFLKGGVIVVGSALDESDLDSYIDSRWATYSGLYDRSNETAKNWIVTPSIDEVRKDNLEAAGFFVINATAEEFFNQVYLSIRPRKAADIIIDSNPGINKAFKVAVNSGKASTWFSSSFKLVKAEIESARKEKGILKHFITGEDPSWFFLVNKAHAELSKHFELANQISSIMLSHEYGVGVMHVTGPSGSGKTTTIRAALLEISKSYVSIYEFCEGSAFDSSLLRIIMSNITEKSVFVFYSAAEYYFAINYLLTSQGKLSRPFVLFILEDRSSDYEKSKRQIEAPYSPAIFYLGELNIADATEIARRIEDHGIKDYKNFSEHPLEVRARIILDKERGFMGDLLSALFSLTDHENFQKKIFHEYQSVESVIAKNTLVFTAMMDSFGLPVPINYVAGVLKEESLSGIQDCLENSLAGIVIYNSKTATLRCRHRVIASYYLDNCIFGHGDKEFLVDVLEFLSRQYTVDDIKFHPLAFRMYKNIISNDFVVKFLPVGEADLSAGYVYHEAQRFYGGDGVFWLQYGIYFKGVGRLDDAIDCFRTGINHYDSFHTRNSLGMTLVEKYISDGCQDESAYMEGINLLENERVSRSADPYPLTSMLSLLRRVHSACSSNIHAERKLKECLKYAMNNFKGDKAVEREVKLTLKCNL